MNDSPKNCNCHVKPVYIEGRLHLCIFVVCDKTINPGDELRYNYGNGLKLPWRKNKVNMFAMQLLE